MSSKSAGYGGKDGPPVLTVRKPLVNLERTWAKRAECLKDEWVDVDFFVSMEQRDEVEKAKRVCRRCPVFVGCLEYALDNDIEFGIWGGLTPSEREEMFGRKAP